MTTNSKTPQKQKRRSLKRRIKKALIRPFLKFGLWIGPYCYYWYMILVWHTSRVEFFGMEKIIEGRKINNGALAALWHENVFFVAYAFRELRPSTLASLGDLGELITRMLKMCNFEIFRGGSSKGKSRKKTQVLQIMIKHMQDNDNILYGITVDGSSGPPFKSKKGVVMISKATNSPVYSVHVFSKPTFCLPSWDKTRVPIPFSKIAIFSEGPYFFSSDTSEEKIKEDQLFLDQVLMETKERAEYYLATGELKQVTSSLKPPIFYKESVLRKGPLLLRGDEAYQQEPKRKTIKEAEFSEREEQVA